MEMMMALTWLDHTEPAVRSAIVSGGWGKEPHSTHGLPVPSAGEIDTIAEALAIASSTLARLTGFSIHPAGTALEEFTVEGSPVMLRLQYSPLREIREVQVRNRGTGLLEDYTGLWWRWENAVRFNRPRVILSPVQGSFITDIGLGCNGNPAPLEFAVTYRFGSTITASARAAVISLAHQNWLATSRCSECEECMLPENTSSVTREGITYTMDTPGTVTEYDRTGLLGVDRWIASINPRRSLTRSAVYAPDSPPGVVRSLWNARPTWVA